MGPRKGGSGGGGGGKKKGSAKKRKSNVWDDYTAPDKRSKGSGGDDDDSNAQATKKLKRAPKESMFGQWKKNKQVFQNKKRSFATSVDAKKHAQREQYRAQQQQHADALYADVDASARMTKKQRLALLRQQKQQHIADAKSNDANDSSDSSDSDASSTGNRRATNKRSSVFAQFVETFRPTESVAREDDDSDANDNSDEDDSDEYEEVLVNEHGEAIDDDGNVIDEATADDDEDEDNEDNEDEDEDEDDGEEDVDANEQELAQDEDPYRKHFLLSTFDAQRAQQCDALAKRFVPLAAVNDSGDAVHFASPTEYTTSIRCGSPLADDAAIAPIGAITNKLYVRSRLLAAWRAKRIDPATLWPAQSLEATLFHQFCAYNDVFFAAQTLERTATLRRLSAMHVLNHVVKARDTVTRNNERLRKRAARDASDANDDNRNDGDDDVEYRDQGFCRASVLVLLPLRSAALAFVKLLLELLPPAVDSFPNQERFFREYGSATDDDNEKNEKDDATASSNNDGLHEWQQVFAEGNNDDCFQIGLALSRKALRFYSEYHHADIIIASPLGLRQFLGDDVVALDDVALSSTGSNPDAPATVRLSTDVLTSIEVCVIDSASLMMMQNIEHLRHVVRALNVAPKEAPHADFARIREWNLAFLGAYLRQTIVFAHGVEPALHHIVTKCCKNVRGTIKYTRVLDPADGSAAIARVVPQIKQIFQRIDVGLNVQLTAAAEADLRFAYFTKHVFEPLLDHPKKHVLIFIPSYFDYVRVRNLFNDATNKKLIRCVQCCEYTTNKQVSRARTSFFHGKAHVLLVTERFHFYHQYFLRGVRQLVWYAPPQMGEFYPEVLNMLGSTTPAPTISSSAANDDDDVDVSGANESKSSIALFTRLDLFRMQRIVGNKRAERMCAPKAVKPTFLFC